MATFQELNLSKEILKVIEEIGYENPTPIQEQSIPAILNGLDVLGKSHTGTGKTAAFGIPAIEKAVYGSEYPHALIVCPTRELVTQVAMELRKFCKYKEGVKIVPIYGGAPIDRQIQLLKRGCAIVVGTPGRIMDHLNRRTLKLKDIDMVILDEADEMLNMGFKEDIEEILSMMPKEKTYQTIMFSATFPPEILRIAKDFQKDPITVEIKSAQRTIDTIKQVYYEVPKGKKVNALRVLLNHYDPELCMIFCNTKKMVDELSDELAKHDIKAVSIHGDMKQEFRSRVMEQFRSGLFPILIATDVAARGIDVDDIDLVVNFDIPQDNEYYIHRVGRTGRAGKKGVAITLVCGSRQKGIIKGIKKYTKSEITHANLPSSAQMRRANKKAYIEMVKEACDEGITQESMEIANDLLSEGIALENILSALISMTYKNEIIDIEEEEKVKNFGSKFKAITLKLSVGKNDGVKINNIVAAIIEECDINGKYIGKIDIRKSFSLVDIAVEKVDVVLQNMQNTTIRKVPCTVEIDHAPEKKEIKEDSKGKTIEKRREERKKSKSKKESKKESRKERKKDSKKEGSIRKNKKKK